MRGSGNGSVYLDFTTVNTDYKGRFSYTLSKNQCDWTVNGGSSNMSLNSSGLSVGGTFVAASDKRLKFNDKPLVNALDVINKLEPVEYVQTYE